MFSVRRWCAQLGLALALGSGAWPSVGAVEVGEQAPDVAWHQGERQAQLKDWSGRFVLVDFWATWCAPCRVSLPWLAEMQQKYAAAGLRVLPINLDKSASGVAAFLQRHAPLLPFLSDPSGQSAQAFDVKAMPSSYLISPTGQVLLVHRGFTTDGGPALEALIRMQLGMPQ